MLDFPASPTNGQKYPQPAVTGVPVYTWDGEKWTTAGGEIVTATPATALPLMDATPAVVGLTLKYAREDHVHPTDITRAPDADTVKTTVQTLTAPQQLQARNNIYAAPYDAMAYSGMQINGGMEVSQELGGAGRTTSGYVCDGSAIAQFSTASLAIAQATSAFVSGFPNHIFMWVNTAQASLLSGQFVALQHPIEGYRIARLQWGTANAQPITLGFWSGHHRSGIYSGSIRNGAANRSYAFTYTQAVPDVPQYNVITISGDTAGTWANGNTTGLTVTLAAASGTDYTAPSANVWLAGNYVAAPGQVNAVAATSDQFRITGVTVLPGTQAPTAAQSPNIMRPYDQELVTCQRYYRKLGGSAANELVFGGYGVSGGGFYTTLPLSPPMRASPTLAQFGSWSVSNASAVPSLLPGTTAFAVGVVNITTTGYAQLSNTATGGISADARL